MRLGQDPIPESWVKLSFRRHFHGHLKKLFKRLLESDQVEQSAARFETHQQVKVTTIAGITPRVGTKDLEVERPMGFGNL